MRQKIRAITAKQSSTRDLRGYLEGDGETIEFALEQLTARRIYDRATLDAIQRQFPKFDRGPAKLAIQYLQSASPKIYLPAMLSLTTTCNSMQRVMLLNALRVKQERLSSDFLDQLVSRLSICKSYQEVDLLLRLLESHKHSSAIAISQALPLLDRAELFIARRAYWFLKDLSLEADQRSRVEAFRQEHSDIL